MYSVSTTGGEVSAASNWSGTPDLSLEISCPTSHTSKTGPTGLYVSVTSTPGMCEVTIAEPSDEQATVSYILTLQYPSE
jgi:hypothetical protein